VTDLETMCRVVGIRTRCLRRVPRRHAFRITVTAHTPVTILVRWIACEYITGTVWFGCVVYVALWRVRVVVLCCDLTPFRPFACTGFVAGKHILTVSLDDFPVSGAPIPVVVVPGMLRADVCVCACVQCALTVCRSCV